MNRKGELIDKPHVGLMEIKSHLSRSHFDDKYNIWGRIE